MWRKLFGLVERQRALDGLDDEVRDHIERETEINIARGMTPDEARRQARLAFGNATLVQEDARAAWTWTWLEQARQDLRFGARILKNSPGLSVTAAVLIALVIGINTTIYSMINALVTQPAVFKAQLAWQARTPSSKPRLWQLWLRRSAPSHCSAPLATPSPQTGLFWQF